MRQLLAPLARSFPWLRVRLTGARRQRSLPARARAAETETPLPRALTSPAETPLLTAGAARPAFKMSTPNTVINQAVTAMLAALDDYLTPILPPGPPPPPPPASLPAAGLSLVSVAERAVGLGNRRGTDLLGPFAVLALKGARLEAVVRYQFWATDPGEVDTLVSQLQTRLTGDATQLRAAGFLNVAADATASSDFLADLNFWRRTADFRVLFEFRYQDADGAESVLARIPIDVEGEPPINDSTSVSGNMVRWDDVAAPRFAVRRGRTRAFRVNALTILAFLLDGWDGAGVTITAATGGSTVQQVFATARDFFNAFALETETVLLGGQAYRAGRMNFPNAHFTSPVVLSGDSDVFRVVYDPATPDDQTPRFDDAAVVYLRVL